MRPGRIGKLHPGAWVMGNTVELVFDPEEAPPLGALPRIVRLQAFEDGEPRAGRVLVVGFSWGDGRTVLQLSKPLHLCIHAAAPDDLVITDCPDVWP